MTHPLNNIRGRVARSLSLKYARAQIRRSESLCRLGSPFFFEGRLMKRAAAAGRRATQLAPELILHRG